MLHRFEIGGRKLALYQRNGESFEHVALKALCYALHVGRFPGLEIERNPGGRYTPDVSALGEDGRPLFWGECGSVSLRKVGWLAKHSGAREIAFVKLGAGTGFAFEARSAVEQRYRPPGRIAVFGFRESAPAELQAASLVLGAVPPSWYRRTEV